jgi:hypothetical protein
MAVLGQRFNPTEHSTEQRGEYENLPDGIYILEVTSSDVKSETNKTVLKVTYDVVEPEQYNGRKIFGNFNLMNPSTQAQEIGLSQFASLCRALEITKEVEDSEDLHFKAFTAKVGLGKPSKDGQYPARNEVKRWYFPDEGNLPAPEITGPARPATPANDNRAAANDNRPAASTGAKRTWGKK